MINERVKLRFIGRTPDGKLVKGSPGNYKLGEITTGPLIWAQVHPKIWELVEPAPELKIPNIFESDNVFEERNIIEQDKHSLTIHTNNTPRVGVLIISFLRPLYLSQCLEAVSRVKIPIKVYLVNQGDKSNQMSTIVNHWSSKLNLIYRENKQVEGLSNMKRWGMESMKADDLEYCMILDDDALLMKDSLEKLVEVADNHKDYHTISGFLIERGTLKLMVGGSIQREKNFIMYPRDKYSAGFHQVEWAGGGFTIHRLEPLVLHDPAYIIGLEDYDYSFELKKRGLKIGVTGDAGAYHKILVDKNGRFTKYENKDYSSFRMGRKRLQPSFDRFKKKWGIEVR